MTSRSDLPPEDRSACEWDEVDPAPVCGTCSSQKTYKDCWNCGGEGVTDHDCGEDCCACLYPEDNVECDICAARGGFYVCATCYPESFDDC